MTRSHGADGGHNAIVRQYYHQLAPRTADGGRKIIYRCPYCSRLWLMNGRGAGFALRTPEQRRFYLRELAVDPLLAPFPLAVCRPCGLEFGGLYSVEEYFRHEGSLSYSRGFRLRWEEVKPYPTDAHLSCSILTLGEETDGRGDWCEQLSQVELDVVLSSLSCVEGVVAWLKRLPAPGSPLSYLAPGEAAGVAPVVGGKGQRLEWKGNSWFDWCPPLRDTVLVSMAIALPPGGQCPTRTLLELWAKVLPGCRGELLRMLLGIPRPGALV
jgi:hypothetical protein